MPLGAAALGERTLGERTLTERLTVEGDGWRLVLMPGWRVTRAGTRLEVRPPAS